MPIQVQKELTLTQLEKLVAFLSATLDFVLGIMKQVSSQLNNTIPNCKTHPETLNVAELRKLIQEKNKEILNHKEANVKQSGK